MVPTVTLAGIVSTTVIVPESDGPALVTVCARVYVPPAVTGSDPLLSVFVTTKFAPVIAVVLALMLLLFVLFGSPLDDDAETVLVMAVP
jgi:hypothetical protein